MLAETMLGSRKVLNVGGGANRGMPKEYEGWHQDLLDIDPDVKPDLLCDAKEMRTLQPSSYDAVFCSHTLEHFYRHEIPQVLAGFLHVLKPTGFAHVIVPDMTGLFQAIAGKDIHDVWYESAAGPITFHDVIYGWGQEIQRGNLYYCHKTGFTDKSLAAAMRQAGFQTVMLAQDGGWNLYGFGFKAKPEEAQLIELGLA